MLPQPSFSELPLVCANMLGYLPCVILLRACLESQRLQAPHYGASRSRWIATVLDVLTRALFFSSLIISDEIYLFGSLIIHGVSHSPQKAWVPFLQPLQPIYWESRLPYFSCFWESQLVSQSISTSQPTFQRIFSQHDPFSTGLLRPSCGHTLQAYALLRVLSIFTALNQL